MGLTDGNKNISEAGPPKEEAGTWKRKARELVMQGKQKLEGNQGEGRKQKQK